jgi:hypothetical protein
MKEARKKLDDEVNSRSQNMRCLVRNVKVRSILEKLTPFWIRHLEVLNHLDIDKILEWYSAINQYRRNGTKESSTIDNHIASTRVPETVRSSPSTSSSFMGDETASHSVKETKCESDIERDIRQELLRGKRFSENEILDSKGTISTNFIQELENGMILKGLLANLKESEQWELISDLGLPDGRTTQEKYRQLTTEIQKLESKLVSTTIIAEVFKSLSEDNHSDLVGLTQTLSKISNSAMADKGASNEKSLQDFSDVAEACRHVVKFWPFVVMPSMVVGEFVPHDHKFDLGIIDEASQSTCSEFNVMVRCKQLLVVGDDKQVCPSQVCTNSGDRIRDLTAAFPGIKTETRLLPKYSFFDHMVMVFSANVVGLREHFRSVPAIIRPSNKEYYGSTIVSLRSPTIEEPLTIVFVKGTKSNDVNTIEAHHIAGCVYDRILKAAEGGHVKTIGIISMGGKEQIKELKKVVEKRIDDLRLMFGADILNSHQLHYGDPSHFQGDERDVIFLSGVHSTFVEKANGLKEKAERKWNVALTRAKDQVILVLSYEPSDLKNTCDVRRPILDCFCNRGPLSLHQDMECACVSTAETELVRRLKEFGYEVELNGGEIWKKSLRVLHKEDKASSSALICVENADESEEEWLTIVNEQESLERAGRSCLRVNYLSLCFHFDAAFKDVIDFLQRDVMLSDASSIRSQRNEVLCRISEDMGSTSLSTDSSDSIVDVKRNGPHSQASDSKDTRLASESIPPPVNVVSEPSPELCKAWAAWKGCDEHPKKCTKTHLLLLIGETRGSDDSLNSRKAKLLTKAKLLETWVGEQDTDEFAALEVRMTDHMNSMVTAGSKMRKYSEDSDDEE